MQKNTSTDLDDHQKQLADKCSFIPPTIPARRDILYVFNFNSNLHEPVWPHTEFVASLMTERLPILYNTTIFIQIIHSIVDLKNIYIYAV